MGYTEGQGLREKDLYGTAWRSKEPPALPSGPAAVVCPAAGGAACESVGGVPAGASGLGRAGAGRLFFGTGGQRATAVHRSVPEKFTTGKVAQIPAILYFW